MTASKRVPLQVSGLAPRPVQLQVGAEISLDGGCTASAAAAKQQRVTNEGPQTPVLDLPVGSSSASEGTMGTVCLEKDRAAIHLASQQQAGVVAAASALTALLTLSSDTGSSWQLPVHVSRLQEVITAF